MLDPAACACLLGGSGRWGSASSSRPSGRSPHRGVGASGSIRMEPMRKQRAPPSTCRSACHEVGWGSGAASADRSCRRGRLGKAVAGARRGSVLDAGQPRQRAVGRTGQGGPPASSGAMSIASPPSHLFGSARRIEQGHPSSCQWRLACLMAGGRRVSIPPRPAVARGHRSQVPPPGRPSLPGIGLLLLVAVVGALVAPTRRWSYQHRAMWSWRGCASEQVWPRSMLPGSPTWPGAWPAWWWSTRCCWLSGTTSG